MQVLVPGEATPQARGHAQAGGAVAKTPQAPVGGVAQAEVARAAEVAMAARQVLLQRHQVTLFDSPALRRLGAQRGDMADAFVAQDDRAA